ncbi:MAG: hypothetical protein IIB21_07135, partial [Chloroflexi bacterium]|nr:hypothetical protein [Chloroflexota bacterium]
MSADVGVEFREEGSAIVVSKHLATALLLALSAAAVLVGARFLPSGPAARALPPAGIEIMSAAAEVTIPSRLGTE